MEHCSVAKEKRDLFWTFLTILGVLTIFFAWFLDAPKPASNEPPFLYVSKAELLRNNQADSRITVEIQNDSESPAMGVKVIKVYEYSDTGIPKFRRIPDDCPVAIIPANKSFQSTVSLSQVNDSDFELIKAGKLKLYVIVTIEYYGSDKKGRYSQYLGLYEPLLNQFKILLAKSDRDTGLSKPPL